MKDIENKIIRIKDNGDCYLVYTIINGEKQEEITVYKNDKDAMDQLYDNLIHVIDTNNVIGAEFVLPTAEKEQDYTKTYIITTREGLVIKTDLHDENLVATVENNIATKKPTQIVPINKTNKTNNKNVKNLVIRAAAVVILAGTLFTIVKSCSNKKMITNTTSSSTISQQESLDNEKISATAKLLKEQIEQEKDKTVDQSNLETIIKIANMDNKLVNIEGVNSNNFYEIVRKPLATNYRTDMSYVMRKIAVLNGVNIKNMPQDVFTPVEIERVFEDYIKDNNQIDNEKEYNLVKTIAQARRTLFAAFYQEGKTKDQIVSEVMPQIELLVNAEEAIVNRQPVLGVDINSVSELCEVITCMELSKADDVIEALNIKDYSNRALKCSKQIDKNDQDAISAIANSLSYNKNITSSQECASKVLTKK